MDNDYSERTRNSHFAPNLPNFLIMLHTDKHVHANCQSFWRLILTLHLVNDPSCLLTMQPYLLKITFLESAKTQP